MIKFFAFSIALCSFLLARPVQAQSFSLQMTPKQYEIVSQRNKVVTLPYTLTNLGDPQVITLSLYTLSVKDNEGNYDIVHYQQAEDTISFQTSGNTVSLDTPFLLKSKNTVDFELEITIPEAVRESDYLFSLVAETETQQGFGNTSSVVVQGGIGSNIILSVTDSGDLDQKGSIAQYELLNSRNVSLFGRKFIFFNSGEFIPVMLIASNTGNNITKVSGSLTLIPQAYKTKQDHPSFTIPPHVIPAGSQRILRTTSDSVCNATQSEQCKIPHSLMLEAPFIGIYKLAAVLSFGESSQISYGNVTFITFPFIQTSIGIVTIILLVFIFLRLRKRILA